MDPHSPEMPHVTTLDLLVDGYISQSFGSRNAEDYLCGLLRMNQSHLNGWWLFSPTPNGSGVRFVARPAAGTLPPRPLMQDLNGHPLWLIDYSVMDIGTVVPQTLWSPARNTTGLRQYVAEASLQLPIYFIQEDGRLGLPLSDAAGGNCESLHDAQMQARLGGGFTTTIRILWPGYNDFERQIHIRDETPFRVPITIKKFAHHIGRSVDAFLRNGTPSVTRNLSDNRWIIEQNGVDRSNIRVIGAIHVSAGSWMPILQLDNNVWIF